MLIQMHSPFLVSLAVYNERLAIILGGTTLLSALTVFCSCRFALWLFSQTPWRKLATSAAYRRFIKYHNYYWWLFWLLFVIHLLAAIMHLGFKNLADPDAYLHTYSLIFGLAALLSLLLLSFSCRGFLGIFLLFSPRNATDFKFFSRFYQMHTYFWVLFWLAIAVHFTAGFLHSGFWPSG
jgi:hypothetical protein